MEIKKAVTEKRLNELNAEMEELADAELAAGDCCDESGAEDDSMHPCGDGLKGEDVEGNMDWKWKQHDDWGWHDEGKDHNDDGWSQDAWYKHGDWKGWNVRKNDEDEKEWKHWDDQEATRMNINRPPPPPPPSRASSASASTVPTRKGWADKCADLVALLLKGDHVEALELAQSYAEHPLMQKALASKGLQV